MAKYFETSKNTKSGHGFTARGIWAEIEVHYKGKKEFHYTFQLEMNLNNI